MKRIIFLHGGPGFTDYLKPFFENSIDGYSCEFYDQLQGANIQIDDLIHQLNELVDVDPEHVVLLGHSWGGVLATEYALRFQDKVKALILMSTGLSSHQWVQYTDELEAAGKEDITKLELFFTERERNAGQALFNHECWSGFSEETFDSLFETYLKDYNLLERLPELKIPMLNIYGEKDLRFSKNVTTTFKKKNSDMIELEILGCGHFPFLMGEDRDRLVGEVLRFLDF